MLLFKDINNTENKTIFIPCKALEIIGDSNMYSEIIFDNFTEKKDNKIPR